MDLIFIADDIENPECENIPENQKGNFTENETYFPSPLFATAEELDKLKQLLGRCPYQLLGIF